MNTKNYTIKERTSFPATLSWLPYIIQIFYLAAIVMTGRGDYAGQINIFGEFNIKIDDLFNIGLLLWTILTSFAVSEVLMPRLLFKKKYILYFLSILIIVLITASLIDYIQKLLIPYLVNKKNIESLNIGWVEKLFNSLVLFIILIGPFTFWKILIKWTRDNNRIHELEKETIQSELQQLKNQINPHFLFNILNNANVLIHKDPDKASETLLGLSELLRYQLYESERQSVLLVNDIKELKDFLNLEKLRRDHFEFSIDVIGEMNSVLVPPLLFIPFVENAVKHNLDPEKTSYIHIVFEIENQYLNFSCVNSKPREAITKVSNGGIGLDNSYRRLKLLYEDNYTLDIKDEKDTFTVDLKIPL